MALDGEVESLNRQLSNLRDNLRLIDERMSEYVRVRCSLSWQTWRVFTIWRVASTARQDPPGLPNSRDMMKGSPNESAA